MSARHSKQVPLTNINETRIYQLLIVIDDFKERKKKCLVIQSMIIQSSLVNKDFCQVLFFPNFFFFQSTKSFFQSVLALHMFYMKNIYSIQQKSNNKRD